MARMGSYLERDIALLFERIGFNVSLNSKEFGFEIDVLAKKDNFKILIQTKQYDNSYINVRDLLHQWASKGKHTGADRILVVIAGFSISDKHFQLAKELGVYLWDDNFLYRLKRIETNKELYEKIGSSLKFKDIIKKLEKEKQKEDELKLNMKTQVDDIIRRQEIKRQEIKRQEKERRRRKRKIKTIIILIAIGVTIILLTFYYLNFNKEKFKNSCLSSLQISKPQFNVKKVDIIDNYEESLSWVKSNGGSSGSLFLTNNDFNNLEYPIVLIEGRILSNIQNNLYPEEFCLCKKAEIGDGLGIGCIHVN